MPTEKNQSSSGNASIGLCNIGHLQMQPWQGQFWGNKGGSIDCALRLSSHSIKLEDYYWTIFTFFFKKLNAFKGKKGVSILVLTNCILPIKIRGLLDLQEIEREAA